MFDKDYLKKLKRSASWPSEKLMGKGPTPIIECIEEIPCNPCETVCPKNCIEIGNCITDLPKFTSNECTGCGKCVVTCPGLAIFLLDNTYSEHKAAITIPYELLPLPQKGEIVIALDRKGKPVCDTEVIKVVSAKRNNSTNLVTMAIPKKFIDLVRFFKFK